MSASRIASFTLAGLIAMAKTRSSASIDPSPPDSGATVGSVRASIDEMSPSGAPTVYLAPTAHRKRMRCGQHQPYRRLRRSAMPIAAIVAIGMAGCGGSTAPTRTDAARSLVAVYQNAGVTVSDSEVQCADRKVVAALNEADAGAEKLTDLSMKARGKVADAVEACFQPASLKQVYEKVVAKDAGLSPTEAACLSRALIAKKVSYGGVVRQRRREVEILGNEARTCLTKRQG